MTMIDPATLEGSYEELFERAMELTLDGDLDEAESILKRLKKRLGRLSEKSFRRRPDLKRLLGLVLSTWGMIQARREDWQEALALQEEALACLDPQEQAMSVAAAKRILLKAKKELEGPEAIVDELRALTVLEPSLAWPCLMLGEILLDQEEEEEAETVLKQAIQRSTEQNVDLLLAHFLLFSLYERQGRLQEAEDTWQSLMEGIEDERRDFRPVYAMYLRHGNLEKAEHWLEKEEWSTIQKEFYRGMIARARGDHEAAIRHWKLATSHTPKGGIGTGELISWASAALRVKHNPKRIISQLRLLDLEEEKGWREQFLLGLAYLADGQLEHAHRAFQKAADQSAETFRETRAQFFDEHRSLFEEYLADENLKAEFAPYLETFFSSAD